MEIERKYLIESVDRIGFDIENFPKKRYVQAYISTDPTIRLRDEAGDYVLCIKNGGGMAQEEFEISITKAQFDSLWAKVETAAVVKDRYFIPLADGLTAELDIYCGELSGLLTAEVEFETIDGANTFSPPEWFGKDVTFDGRYKNASLAKYGLPE